MNKKYLKKLEYFKVISMISFFAQSDIAKLKILDILPSISESVVNQLLLETKDVIDLLLEKGSPNFSGIKDITSINRRLKVQATLNTSELLVIRDNLYLSRLAKDYIKEKNEFKEIKPNCIREKISNLQSVKNLEDKIRRCIISPDEIADEASSNLLRIRRSIINSKAQVKDKLNSFIRSEKYKKYLQDSLVTMRSNRYVIPVKREYQNEIKGIVHDMSSSGATLFVEPIQIVNINNKVRQLLLEEKEEINLILKNLSIFASEYINDIVSNYSILIDLDIVYAKGKFALEYECTIPKINMNKYIKIIKGKHPLIDKNEVVPIDFHIGDGFNTLVITGPNTGGKTVSLKTVGLFTLMAQSGLAIPAKQGSEISIFNNIFADIGDEQSIEQSLSTFSSHMTNIISILKQADESSLVLLDELGAGTDPTEGSALALAIIEYLMSKKCTSIATTHYSEIKLYASVNENIENASCEFDVKTLSPTYKLLIGIPGKSNALYISRRLGLNQKIIENSKKFIDSENNEYENVILSLEKSRQKIVKEENRTRKNRIEIETLKKELQNKIKNIDIEKSKILIKADEKAKDIILNAKNKSEEIIIQLNKLKKDGKIIINAKEEANLKNILKNTVITDSKVKIKRDNIKNRKMNIKIGDEIIIIDINQKATILKLPDKNGDVLVQAGILKINIHISNIKSNKNEEKIPFNTFNFKKSDKLKLELDIRGMTILDAEIKIDKFIDDAYLTGLIEVSIIHGKGTGALRVGVHKFLKLNRNVKTFRLGKYGEGESGVTIITLNDH